MNREFIRDLKYKRMKPEDIYMYTLLSNIVRYKSKLDSELIYCMIDIEFMFILNTDSNVCHISKKLWIFLSETFFKNNFHDTKSFLNKKINIYFKLTNINTHKSSMIGVDDLYDIYIDKSELYKI